MNNAIVCKSLFSFNSILFRDIFSPYSYPWEVIPHITDIIEFLLKERPEEYALLRDKVLVGKDVRISQSAEIIGPAMIGHGTEIRHNAFLRESVLIGNGCVVGNSCEIKNSILMDHAQVPHFNYVGDSVLGEKAHLGAGVIISNLRSDKKKVRVISADGCIETGLKKFGAVIGDNVEIGCGAVLCPGTVIGKNATIYPLTLARGIYRQNCIVKRDNTVVDKEDK